MFFCFDCDGTLTDTFGIFRKAFDAASERVGGMAFRFLEEAHIRTLEAQEVLRFHGIQEEDFGAVAEGLRDGMEGRKDEASLFPGVAAVLTQLHESGHHLGYISSNSDQFVKATLEGLSDLFEYKVAGVGLRDKAPVLVDTFARFTSEDKCFYIGDEIRDVRAAQQAGVHFVGVSWGYNTEAALQEAGCEVVLREPHDLLALAGAKNPTQGYTLAE